MLAENFGACLSIRTLTWQLADQIKFRFMIKHLNVEITSENCMRGSKTFCQKIRFWKSFLQLDCQIATLFPPMMSSYICHPSGLSFQDPSDLLQYVKKSVTDGKYHCSLCGVFSHKYSSCTRNHVESKHFPNAFAYPCDECDLILSTKTSFNLHRSRTHTAKNKLWINMEQFYAYRIMNF